MLHELERIEMNVYINFVLYAVLGKMAEADDLMRCESERIARVARAFSRRLAPPAMPLYRGMIVDRSQRLEVCPERTFVSWTEDIDVACWFASRESIVSEYLAATDARLQGVVLKLDAPQCVLFHHSWAHGWAQLALLHPHMGEYGARQIAWSLSTQREVITAPLKQMPEPLRIENVRTRSVSELDAMFAPEWIIEQGEANENQS